LDEGIMTMTFNFKAPKHNVFKVSTPSALVVRLNPEPAIYFKTNLLKPLSKGSESISDEMKYTLPGRKVAGDKLAYEVVIGNVFKGDQSGFVREDEVIASWEIFTP
jgi:glucose-6-phosphate 1-dehydrogenase